MTSDDQHVLQQDSAEKPDPALTVTTVDPRSTSHISDPALTVSTVDPGRTSHISDPALPVSPDNEQQAASRFTYEEGDLMAPVPTVENQERLDRDVAVSSNLPLSPDTCHERSLAGVINKHSGEDASNRAAKIQR